MKKVIIILFIVSLILLSGCTEKQEEKFREKYEGEIKEEIKGVVKEAIEESGTNVRKNCRELNGYLCNPRGEYASTLLDSSSSQGECDLEWLDSSDSYCCPIPCGTCPEDVNCEDNDRCTEDSCVIENSNAVCKHRQMHPCANNGICERGETSIVHSPCCPGVACAETEVVALSDDCPKTCDDKNPNTADYYNFSTQSCGYKNCMVVSTPNITIPEDGLTSEVEDLIKVKGVTLYPEQPEEGDPILFTVVLENQGDKKVNSILTVKLDDKFIVTEDRCPEGGKEYIVTESGKSVSGTSAGGPIYMNREEEMFLIEGHSIMESKKWIGKVEDEGEHKIDILVNSKIILSKTFSVKSTENKNSLFLEVIPEQEIFSTPLICYKEKVSDKKGIYIYKSGVSCTGISENATGKMLIKAEYDVCLLPDKEKLKGEAGILVQ